MQKVSKTVAANFLLPSILQERGKDGNKKPLCSSSFITDATGTATEHLQSACRSIGAGKYPPFMFAISDGSWNEINNNYLNQIKKSDESLKYPYIK